MTKKKKKKKKNKKLKNLLFQKKNNWKNKLKIFIMMQLEEILLLHYNVLVQIKDGNNKI